MRPKLLRTEREKIDRQTDRHTHTDRKVKTEGPKIKQYLLLRLWSLTVQLSDYKYKQMDSNWKQNLKNRLKTLTTHFNSLVLNLKHKFSFNVYNYIIKILKSPECVQFSPVTAQYGKPCVPTGDRQVMWCVINTSFRVSGLLSIQRDCYT